jgi:RHS repeat-associated protein
VTSTHGVLQSSTELDPYGAEVGAFESNSAFQPRKFTSYERDANGTDEAMLRRYNRWHSRFDQPDPYDGSYNLTDPQSFNRYSYTQSDPVNFIDPTGFERCWNVDKHEWEDCGDMKDYGPPVVTNTWNYPYDLWLLYVHGLMISQEQRADEPVPFSTTNVGGALRKTATEPKKIPLRCKPTGSGDIGGSLISPVFVGGTGGVQLDSRGVYGYAGITAGLPPGKGFQIMGGNSPVSPGLNVQASLGTIFAWSYSANVTHAKSFKELWSTVVNQGSSQFGGMFPGYGGGGSMYVVFPIYIFPDCR